jgi:hypothetical protein
MSKRKSRSKQQWAFVGNRRRRCSEIFGVNIPIPADLGFQAERRISDKLSEAINSFCRAKIASHEHSTSSPTEEWLKAAAKSATHVWRAERRIVDPETREPLDDFKLLHRDIIAIRRSLEDLGVEIVDSLGSAYHSGMALKVISFEPTPGLSREEIKETIKPTVLWRGNLLQLGEVIVGTPQTNAAIEETTHE